MARGPAQNPAQHIAAPLVRRQHTISHQERDRAKMVRYHAHRPIGLVLLPIPNPGPGGHGAKQRRKHIAVIVAIDTLCHCRQTFQSHASIDAGPGQGMQLPPSISIELHEDEIPDLDDAIARAVRPIVARHRRSLVEMKFRTGPTGSGISHLPEVIFFVATHDARIQHAYFLP